MRPWNRIRPFSFTLLCASLATLSDCSPTASPTRRLRFLLRGSDHSPRGFQHRFQRAWNLPPVLDDARCGIQLLDDFADDFARLSQFDGHLGAGGFQFGGVALLGALPAGRGPASI